MSLQVAANLTTMFRELGPLGSRFGGARGAGFRVVEVSLPYSETPDTLASHLEEQGLTQILINSDPGNIEKGEMGCACVPGKEEAFKHSLHKSITYAKALKVPMLHIMVGKKDPQYSQPQHTATLLHNLTYAANTLTQEGIVGLIEPKNNITFPGYFLNDYDAAVDLLSQVGSPHLRLLLDIFHLQFIAGNITHNIQRLMPYTGHVQVSQPPLRTEPGSPGELDFVYIINTLKAAGYKGYIGAEYVPSTKKTEDSMDWIKTCGLTL